ncbi:hypothetical protein J2743_001864 [Methanobacterium petrolearium]|nr:hypothetical protein [Methanobacterium petrolearium]BDZ69853.1 hypothetical protein GCM10025861_03700 [Methanobacterium petrolearium]
MGYTKKTESYSYINVIRFSFFLYSQQSRPTIIIIQKIRFRIVTGSGTIAIIEHSMHIIFMSRYVKLLVDNITRRR